MKILLVQTSYLGDVILSTPVIAEIHKRHPGCELWMLTSPAAKEFVSRDHLLSGVITYDKRGEERGWKGFFAKVEQIKARRFDLAYALQRSSRTALLLWAAGIPERVGFRQAGLSLLYSKRIKRPLAVHDVLRNLAILESTELNGKAEKPETKLRLYAPAADQLTQVHREHLSAARHLVVVVPGSARMTKRWWWQGFREVARHFAALGNTVVVLGSDSEVELCEKVSSGLNVLNLAGQTHAGEMIAYVQKASLLICNDSVPLHLGSAFAIPTVALFCATSPSFGFGPWGNPARVLEVDGLLCKPCSIRGGSACPTSTNRCMTGVSPGDVIEAAGSLLRSV